MGRCWPSALRHWLQAECTTCPFQSQNAFLPLELAGLPGSALPAPQHLCPARPRPAPQLPGKKPAAQGRRPEGPRAGAQRPCPRGRKSGAGPCRRRVGNRGAAAPALRPLPRGGRRGPDSFKMDVPKEVQPTGQFTCQLCGLTAPYSHYGQKPPNTRSIVLLEECYVMKDPFTPDKHKFLILGSHCSLCSRSVCVGTECSLFYSKRFCLPCVNENLKAFPLEIQEDMDKKKPQSKSLPCKKRDTST